MHPRTLDPRTLGEAAGRGSTRDDGASTAAATAALLLADLRQSGSGTASGDDDDCARGAALAGVSVDANPCVAVKSDSLLRDRSIFAGGSSLWHSGFLAVAVLAWWIAAAALLGLTVFVVGMKETAVDPAQPLIKTGNEHSFTHSALLPTRPVMGGLNWYELFFFMLNLFVLQLSKFFAYLNRILFDKQQCDVGAAAAARF